ncbi:YybH family protein [Ohtaekwangia koreensis]|uniref:Ketosteroid isomerase homolog n=1 Tax=Ohtaekwangia koreensis TaxID=688867 RepID=A0A1T5MBW7_9BACT|nr:nuclear transport factor 2 family protein [Ohtaekwangia koreensis]SKC85484.1 Ketosteroid isomerase homolog [Ohtaekwangia koreensis]
MNRNKIFTLIRIIIAAAFLYNCSATSTEQSNLEEARKAIEASNEVYFTSFAKGDSSIFIDRYAKDCCILAPNAPALCGESAPLHFFKIAHDEIGLRNGKFIITQIYGDSKEFVTEEGVWQSFDKNNVMFDQGKYLVLWKKTPEGWKMFRDSFSSDKAL